MSIQSFIKRVLTGRRVMVVSPSPRRISATTAIIPPPGKVAWKDPSGKWFYVSKTGKVFEGGQHQQMKRFYWRKVIQGEKPNFARDARHLMERGRTPRTQAKADSEVRYIWNQAIEAATRKGLIHPIHRR